MIGNAKTLPVPIKTKLVADEEAEKLLTRQREVVRRMGEKYAHHPSKVVRS